MSDLSIARQHMIDGQLRPNQVNDERIIDAIESVNRENFVPKSLSGVAYLDEDIAVAPGRYLMEPMVFARLVDAAHIKKTDVVLDVACATGYSSAVLGRLAETVVALEEDAALAEMATTVLATEACDNVAVVTGSLVDGLAKQGPYDVIFINGMIDEVPMTLANQIAEGGRLICVLNQNGVGKAAYVTCENGVVAKRILFDAAVPELTAFKKPKKFIF